MQLLEEQVMVGYVIGDKTGKGEAARVYRAGFAARSLTGIGLGEGGI